MLTKEIYQTTEGVVGSSRKVLIDTAITYALGRGDWTLLEVADRGHYLNRGDGTEVFVFDGTPLLKFRKLVTQEVRQQVVIYFQYELLYDHG